MFFALFYANGDLAFLGPGQVLVIDEGECHFSREVLLGEIVEELKSDSVDEHIRIKIFNSRGVTTRAFAEGGDQERSLAALFKSYRDKVKFKYPRVAKIFTNLMREYERYANHEDCVAQLEDLEF